MHRAKPSIRFALWSIAYWQLKCAQTCSKNSPRIHLPKLAAKTHHAYTCIHQRIQLAVGDMTMSGWKPTISLIHPPPPKLAPTNGSLSGLVGIRARPHRLWCVCYFSLTKKIPVFYPHPPKKALRSPGKQLLSVLQTRTILSAKRYFMAIAFAIWNAFPPSLCHTQALASFKHSVNWLIFIEYFNDW